MTRAIFFARPTLEVRSDRDQSGSNTLQISWISCSGSTGFVRKRANPALRAFCRSSASERAVKAITGAASSGANSRTYSKRSYPSICGIDKSETTSRARRKIDALGWRKTRFLGTDAILTLLTGADECPSHELRQTLDTNSALVAQFNGC
jgi:hypothetical protein